jgi:hypothetical protein
MHEELLVNALAYSDFKLKSPLVVEIRRNGGLGHNRFEGRFKNLPHIVVIGATRPYIVRQLEKRLLRDYALLKDLKKINDKKGLNCFHKEILKTIEEILVPAA